MPTRRSTLLSAGRVVAAAGAAGLAGCHGDGSRTLTPTEAEFDPPAYTDWLAAPGAHGLDSYVHLDHDLDAVRRVQDALDEERYERFRTRFDRRFGFLGLTFGDVGRWLELVEPFLAVLWPAGDPATVEGELSEYEETGSREGFALYEHPGDGRVVGVGSETLVVGLNPEASSVDPATAVRATVDARAGAVDRYVEVDLAFRTLTAQLETGTFSFGNPAPAESGGEERPEGLEAMGSRIRVDIDDAHVAAAGVFEDGGAASSPALRRAVSEHRDLEDVVLSRTGRTAWVTGNQPPDEFSFGTYSR